MLFFFFNCILAVVWLCGCLCFMPILRGAMSWSAVCNCGIFFLRLLAFWTETGDQSFSYYKSLHINTLGNPGVTHSVPTAFMGTEWVTPGLPRMTYKVLHLTNRLRGCQTKLTIRVSPRSKMTSV